MVRWSDPAKMDLKNIFNYIAQDSQYYAKHVVQQIVDKTEVLEAFPKLGRMIPETNDPKIREVLMYSYRILYEVADNDVYILAIIHGKQDFLNVAQNKLTNDT